MNKYCKILLWMLLAGSFTCMRLHVCARNATTDSTTHKVLMGGIVIGTDTFPLGYIPTVFIEEEADPARKAYMARLRYNVAKVYPYAVTAAYVLDQVDRELAKKNTKHDKKVYIRETQKALKKRFKDDLKNLTITQGQILVKLINRETGRDCYDVIKELRGGLNARLSQTAAFLFKNDLKAEYDPDGEDRDIEQIVREIEAQNLRSRITSH